MGAYWHIILPYEIEFLKSIENQCTFDSIYKDDFRYKKRLKYSMSYSLSAVHIQKEFKSFIRDLFTEWTLVYPKLFKTDIDSEELEMFHTMTQQLNSLEIHHFDRNTVNTITKELNNYLYFTTLKERITYKGFPLSNDFGLEVISIIRSDAKMQEEPADEKKLLSFVRHFQKKFSVEYNVSKYLSVVGF